MMVHPSQQRDPHATYATWVTSIRERWQEILLLNPTDPDRKELITEFKTAYEELEQTVDTLPPFSDIEQQLPFVIPRIVVQELNTRNNSRTPQVQWRNDYAHILVGGQAMDRGFTVEGLTVTYMPRGVGSRTADTIQQRARFFGYKRNYLGFCRVYLDRNTLQAYERYIEHEEDIRQQLINHRDSGKALSEWKRIFFLHRSLQPTRNSVLDLPAVRDSFGNKWFTPRSPHIFADVIETNRAIVSTFMQLYAERFQENPGHLQRTDMQKHLMAVDIPLKDVFDNLLLSIRHAHPGDSTNFTGLLLQLERYLEQDPYAPCTVFQMSGGKSRKRSVLIKTARGKNEIPELFQGAYPSETTKEWKVGGIYPGDEKIRNTSQVTIQIHNLVVKTADGDIDDVSAIAVWIPKAIARDAYRQLSE